jgi:hypothetical protein
MSFYYFILLSIFAIIQPFMKNKKRMRKLFHGIYFLGIAVLILFPGCNACDKLGDQVNNATTQITQALDQAISGLGSQSANWQNILNDLLKKLPNDVSNTVRGDVSNLLQRTVATTSGELRCDVDFIRIRVMQELQQIKAKFLGQTLPPLEPHLCDIVPLAVDMRLNSYQRNNIQFFGYDFDLAKVEVFLVSSGNERNVSQFLDIPTHYHMTLNLGNNGVKLDKNSQRIILRWNHQDISTIGIIQPSPAICKTSYFDFTPNKISFIPLRAGSGDTDFGGHGPKVSCNVTLIKYDDKILAHVFMNAIETRSDWTQAMGARDYVIYNADPDKTIEKIITPTNSSFEYIDSNHGDDYFGGNGCIASYDFTGDTDGDEAGIRTKVTLVFNNIHIQLKEKGDCVSEATMKLLSNKQMLDPQTMRALIKFSAAHPVNGH